MSGFFTSVQANDIVFSIGIEIKKIDEEMLRFIYS